MKAKIPLQKNKETMNDYLSTPFVVYTHTHTYIYIYVSWSTLVEGDPNAPFSIATTLRCKKGHYSFPWIVSLTLDPYFIMLSVKQGGIQYHFLSLWYDSTWDWTLVSGGTLSPSCQWVGNLLNLRVILAFFSLLARLLETQIIKPDDVMFFFISAIWSCFYYIIIIHKM